jgi:hypothetical protein
MVKKFHWRQLQPVLPVACILPLMFPHGASKTANTFLALIFSLSAERLRGCRNDARRCRRRGRYRTSVSYTLEGIAYRTFTAPISEVEGVTRTALHRMRIKIQATSKTEQGKTIKAVSNDREIEIELEMAGAKTTRIRTVAKQGIFFKDCASATEIIMQTERVLGV